MSTAVCESCRTEFDASRDACPLCGEPQSEADEDEDDADGGRFDALDRPAAALAARLRASKSVEAGVLYRGTVGLALAYGVFVTGSIYLNVPSLFTAGAILYGVSLVTMYLDLLSLETRLYDVRPILWIVGAALLYFLVLPIYVYKRYHAT